MESRLREDGARLGVLLTIAAIAIAGSRRGRGGAPLARHGRRPGPAGCVVSLYTLLPFVIFFNLARTDIDADVGAGLLIGLGGALPPPACWLVGIRLAAARAARAGLADRLRP